MISPSSNADKIVVLETLMTALREAVIHTPIPARRHEMLAMMSRTKAQLDVLYKLVVETKAR